MNFVVTVSLPSELMSDWESIPKQERSQTVQKLLKEYFSGATTPVKSKLINKQTTSIEKVDQTNPEINEMFEQWAMITGVPINGQQQANRRAAYNLLRKYGNSKLIQLIQGVAKAQGQEFAPQIANFSQLQAKQDSLILWGRKQAQEEQVEKVVKI
jgi:hypothetical protein